MSSSKCIIHVGNATGNVTSVKKKTWNTIIDYANRWKVTDTEQGAVSNTLIDKYEISLCTVEESFKKIKKNVGFHRECYQKFCHKGLIQKSEEKLKKQAGEL